MMMLMALTRVVCSDSLAPDPFNISCHYQDHMMVDITVLIPKGKELLINCKSQQAIIYIYI